MAKFTDRYGGYCTCTREKCSDECSTYRRYKPIPTTNADRFRAMSDEELAEALCLIYGGIGPVQSDGGRAWLDWLQKEAQDDV